MEDAATLVPDEGTATDDAQVDSGAEDSAVPADALTADQLRDELAANNEQLTDSVTASVLAGIDQRNAESTEAEPTAQAVTLSDEQWEYLVETTHIQNTVQTFALMLLAALIGCVLFRYFVGGLRRG